VFKLSNVACQTFVQKEGMLCFSFACTGFMRTKSNTQIYKSDFYHSDGHWEFHEILWHTSGGLHQTVNHSTKSFKHSVMLLCPLFLYFNVILNTGCMCMFID
jgi:hypothetical protein